MIALFGGFLRRLCLGLLLIAGGFCNGWVQAPVRNDSTAQASLLAFCQHFCRRTLRQLAVPAVGVVMTVMSILSQSPASNVFLKQYVAATIHAGHDGTCISD